jgi:WD40 repeat protein
VRHSTCARWTIRFNFENLFTSRRIFILLSDHFAYSDQQGAAMDAALVTKTEIPGAGSRERKTRVFISYSRKDSAFSNRLVDALNARGFEAYLDKKDILPGEPWKERLDSLILSADAIGVVISPDSIASQVCAWEVERTESLQKKMLPLMHRPVADADLPPRLAQLNYVFLREEDDFNAGLSTLAVALETDIAWIRQHTRIGELAQRWHSAGRPAVGGRLLRGEELTDAETWLLTSPKGAPDPTEVQRAYVQASRVFETSEIEKERAQIERTRRFQKRSAWALGSIALLVVAGAAYVLWQQRETDRRETLVLTSATDRAIADKRYDAAMRIAVQGLPSPGRSPVALGWSTHEVTGLEAKLAGAAQLSRLQRVLSGHTDAINSVDFSADGTRIASGSADRTARVWNAGSGELLHELRHDGPVSRVAFSPDGGRILTASSAGTVRVWDTASGNLLREVKVAAGGTLPTRRLVSVTFSADGTRSLTAMQLGRTQVWDVTGGKVVGELKGQPNWLASAAISRDGTRAITAGTETAWIWDATDGAMLHELAGHKDFIHAVAFNPDGTRIVTGAGDRIARVWDVASGELLREFTGHDAAIQAVAFSADGASLVTASIDQTARLWNIATGEFLRELKGHADGVTSVAFSADGRVVTGSSDRTLRIWDVAGEPRPLRHDRDVMTAAFDATGSRVVTASADKTARIWDAATGTMLRELPHKSQVDEASFSPDNALILTRSENMVRVWDAVTGDMRRELRDDGGIFGARFIADGTSTHVVLIFGKHAAIWDAVSGTLVRELKNHSGGFGSPAVSADGRRIADHYGDHARIWDAATGTLVRDITSPGGSVWSTALSPDGKRLVTAETTGLARVWNTDTGDTLQELNGHAGSVSSAAFSADGTRIVTASSDRTARIWDAASGEILREIDGHSRGLWTAVFSPDGGRVVTASIDGTARIWDVSFGMTLRGDALVRTVCARKLAGAQTFTVHDATDPILVGLAGTNPCHRRGPLALEYWTNLGHAAINQLKITRLNPRS